VSKAGRAVSLEAEALIAGDWHSSPSLEALDLILAVDLLYEERDAPAAAGFAAAHLAAAAYIAAGERGSDRGL
jgi:hypothetical protein